MEDAAPSEFTLEHEPALLLQREEKLRMGRMRRMTAMEMIDAAPTVPQPRHPSLGPWADDGDVLSTHLTHIFTLMVLVEVRGSKIYTVSGEHAPVVEEPGTHVRILLQRTNERWQRTS